MKTLLYQHRHGFTCVDVSITEDGSEVSVRIHGDAPESSRDVSLALDGVDAMMVPVRVREVMVHTRNGPRLKPMRRMD